MVSPSTNHANRTTVELIDVEVDWKDIADLGFIEEGMVIQSQGRQASVGLPQHDSELSPVHHFIKYGGTVSLSGTTHQGGYESARRVLLDFANLMDGISGRRLRMLQWVLHIMSDDLMRFDVENGV